MNSSTSTSPLPSVSIERTSVSASSSVIASPVAACQANRSSPACRNPSPLVSYLVGTRVRVRVRVRIKARVSSSCLPIEDDGQRRIIQVLEVCSQL